MNLKTMSYWKLGCRWGSKQDGLPLFFSLLKEHNIVISWVDKDFKKDNKILLTDGFTPLAVAITKSERKPISNLKHLEKKFIEKKIYFDEKLFYYEAEIFPFLIPNFKYESRQGIIQIHNKEIITYIDSFLQKIGATLIGQKSFRTITDNVSPTLDVEILSKNFADLLLNMQDSPGQMLGVFGQWGRGKTYFMKEVCERLHIKNKENSNFYYLNFHAWKYQDTEGVWAYLYQKITEEYLTHQNNELLKAGNIFQKRIWYPLSSKFNEFKLLLKLNIVKNGAYGLIFFLALLFAIITIHIFKPDFYKSFKLSSYVLSGALALQSFNFFNNLWKLGDKGKRIVKKYTHKPIFNKLLGVQAEIQEELKYVLRAWIKTKCIKQDDGSIKEILAENEKRLLLFVDDIDRCKEDRLIQVIDALRVMLEDEEIVKRVLIVTAIDEKILERAIQLKYKDFIDDNESNRKSTLVKEYLDKLFIACIKLPPLYDKEKDVIIDAYANKLDIEIIEKEETENKEEYKKEKQANQKATNTSQPIQDKTKEKTYAIRLDELHLIKESAKKLKGEITPRQLRIFMYRYLLAKNLAKSFNNKPPNKEWCEYVLNSIVQNRNKNLNDEQDLNSIDINSIEGISSNLKSSTQKIIDIVAPY